jgi:hypothetical protein
MRCSRWQISPEDLQKDFNKFDNNFTVELEFEDYCFGSIDKPACMSHVTELNEICPKCAGIMEEEIGHWEKAKSILNAHDMPTIEQAR